MNSACALALVVAGITGNGLEEARNLVHQGLLTQAEQLLAPMLVDDIDTASRARALLLLGNVDYERGEYARAVDRYAQVQRMRPDDESVIEAARDNRALAERRLVRNRELALHASRLRAAVVLIVLLGSLAIVCSARRPSGLSAS